MIVQFSCKCGNHSPANTKFYDGSLGYEAIVCTKCARYTDAHGVHEADEWSKGFVGIKERPRGEKNPD